MGVGAIRCSECGRAVDEFTTIAERWLYYYDSRDLVPYCAECAEREFAEDAPASSQRSGAAKQRRPERLP